MKRLILTGSGFRLVRSGLAEAVIEFCFRFVWGPLPGAKQLEDYFGARSCQVSGGHWSDWCAWRSCPAETMARRHLSFIEFCEPYDAVELWFEPYPNELQLIFLLDFLSSHPAVAAKLQLRIVDFDLDLMGEPGMMPEPDDAPAIKITAAELKMGRAVWQAYRAATPEPLLKCLRSDLTLLPFLRRALLILVAELPSAATGLGATELRLLEAITHYDGSSALGIILRDRPPERVFGELELYSILDGLAHGPTPTVVGLKRPERQGDWHQRYLESRLWLTEFGEQVLAHKADFSNHNPIDRWWGGTHLSNDNLWRCDLTLTRR